MRNILLFVGGALAAAAVVNAWLWPVALSSDDGFRVIWFLLFPCFVAMCVCAGCMFVDLWGN